MMKRIFLTAVGLAFVAVIGVARSLIVASPNEESGHLMTESTEEGLSSDTRRARGERLAVPPDFVPEGPTGREGMRWSAERAEIR